MDRCASEVRKRGRCHLDCLPDLGLPVHKTEGAVGSLADEVFRDEVERVCRVVVGEVASGAGNLPEVWGWATKAQQSSLVADKSRLVADYCCLVAERGRLAAGRSSLVALVRRGRIGRFFVAGGCNDERRGEGQE